MIGKTIGQYQVIDKIGEGGMGAVYKAEDTTLHRLVALKTLSGHLTEDEEAQERFIREAQSASSLNHPNITTVYEFLEDEDTRLICMEYIEGKTIRDMVESGVVSVRKAIDIIMQAAEALDAAHNKGILHRDVKSANIMVNMEGRVKVMDFGLAHLESRSQLTRTGTTMGTLSYSSPEQISGKPVDKRSEIFSLGVVFYELLTGQLPFRAANEAEILFAIINNEPPKLTTVREDIPELVEAVVSRMLEKDNELRYQTCGDVISDLKGIRKEMETSTVGITGVLGRVQASRKKKMVLRLVAGIAVIAFVVASLVLLGRGGLRLNPELVVVAAFENRTGDATFDQQGYLAADWITQGLQRTGIIKFVPALTALQVTQYIKSEIAGGRQLDLIQEIANETGAGIVVSGNYYRDGENIRFQVHITDARTGRPLGSLDPVVGLIESPSDAIELLPERVIGLLASVIDPRLGGLASTTRRPPTIDAYQAFKTGLELYIDYQYVRALPNLYQAFELDPSFHLPAIYACIVLSNQRRYVEEDSLLGILIPQRDELSDYDRCLLDYVSASLHGDNKEALDATRKAAEMAPGSKIVYNQAIAARRLNRPREAIEALESLDPTKGPMRGWQFYWEVLTCSYHMLGEHNKELRAARRGRKQYPLLQSTFRYELKALAALGRIKNVDRVWDACFNLAPQSGRSPHDTMRQAAQELRIHGHLDISLEILNKLIQWYENRPANNRSRYLPSLASTYYWSEQWEKAKELYQELNDQYPNNITILGRLGALAARMGNHEEALEISERLAGFNLPYLSGSHIERQARIAAQLGELEQAVSLLRSAYDQGLLFGREGIESYCDIDLEPLKGYKPFEDLIKPRG